MSLYAVGDLQGCLDPLLCLLERVEFNPQQDTLLLTGDLVNRGPQSLQTLRYIHALGDSAISVLGNHDLHLLAVAHQARARGRNDTLQDILHAEDATTLLHWLRHRPILYQHKNPSFILVHAGIAPQWNLTQASQFAQELEGVLRSDQYVEFLHAMYGDEPDQWDDRLTGFERWRVITNYFTRMRFISTTGSLDLHNKETSVAPQGYFPWFLHPQRKTKQELILFGHWAALQGTTGVEDAIALDTGCVWGGQLSLLCLDDMSWQRCKC